MSSTAPDPTPARPGIPRWTLILMGTLLLALLLRLLLLGIKPPHFDEGVNGFFIDELSEKGFYRYDPENYHGPLHFYLLYLMQTLFGRSVEVLRLPLVLINVATVWLVLEFRRFLSWKVCAVAALALAISPGMIFYSRYAIHEAWQVFALVLTLWGAAELWTRGSRLGLWTTAGGVTLAVLTKETYLLHFAAFALAYPTLRLFERYLSPSAPGLERPVAQQWQASDLATAVGVSIFWTAFFYSGGFAEPAMLRGMLETFNFWSETGTHGDHSKPWYYWWQLFGRYELPALLGALAAITALLPGMNRLLRFIAIWGWGVLVAYTIIPYKTPWCIISILWPFYFLFGEGLRRYARGSWAAPLNAVAGIALILSLGQAIRLNFFRPTNPKEPYVYVQAPNDLFKLTRPIKARAKEHPTTYHGVVHVLSGDYHPLPWLLGDFSRVGYYSRPDSTPEEMDALIIIAEEARMDEVEEAVKDAYFVESFQVRNGLPAGRLYLNADAFAPHFPGRVPELNRDRWHGLRDEEEDTSAPTADP